MTRPRPDQPDPADASRPTEPVVPAVWGAHGELPGLKRSLAEVAARTLPLIEGVDGLGLTVQIGDELVFGGSNAFADQLDNLQYGVMEGPCLVAQATGEIVSSALIGSGEPRWPRFSPPAAALELRSVVSGPLLAAGRVMGTINLYSRSADVLPRVLPEDLARTAELVEQTVSGVVLLAVAEANAGWFARAVRERSEIDLAVGVLVERYAMSTGEAQVLLRQLALEDDVTEVVAARGVLQQDGPA